MQLIPESYFGSSDSETYFNFLSNYQVDIDHLEEYISLVVDATVKTGIIRQMESFRTGFNQVEC